MKSLIAVMAGIVVSGVTGALAQAGGDALLAAWMGIEPITAQGAAALGTDRATESLVVMVLGYFLGPLAGGFIAARLAPSRPKAHAAMVGGFQMIFGVIALLLFPHPVWFAVATALAFVPGALVGAALSRV
jgi:MFS family permease